MTVRETGAETLVELAGELDLATAATRINLTIDLRGLSFLGSTGIGIIIVACKRIRAAGGTFSVRVDNGLTRRTFEVAGLVDYLELHDGEDPHLN